MNGLPDDIPLPSNLELRLLVIQMIPPNTAGLTFGHGIALKNRAYDRRLVIHELVHVLQYERLKGIEPFLKEYLKEISPAVYGRGPLEMQAARIADSMLGRT